MPITPQATARSGQPARWRGGLRALGLCALAVAAPALGQDMPDMPEHHDADNIFDAYARWAVSQGVWKGAVTEFPRAHPRPHSDGMQLRSWSEALTVHAPRDLDPALAERALSSAERAYAFLRETGWPLPPPDGGRGASQGFDIYLQRGSGAPDDFVQARADLPSGVGHYDDALTHALVDPRAPHMDACVTAAIAEAALLSLDPAESIAWRRATARYVAWLATGVFGCDGDGDVDAQRRAAAGLLHRDPDSAIAGALWLAILADREDGGSGVFLRELWQFARQRTRELEPLRASPNLWEVLERSLDNAQERFDDLAVDFAIARYFAGPPGRASRAPYPVLQSLDPAAAVPLEASLALQQHAHHVTFAHNLTTLGSAYVRVHLTDAVRQGDRLKVWLRGEQGPRWALSAVRLGADGAELGRLHAPVRTTPKSFLPLELTPDTRAVLLVVTYLPFKLETITRKEQLDYGAKLIVDLERGR